MKEAAGEANMTVVTIILIGVVVAVATPIINSLMSSSAEKACCTDAGGVWTGGKCTEPKGDNGSFSLNQYNTCVSNSKNK